MLRDPAKAFLVSDEEFDKKIDELGWSLGDMDTMINMYGQKVVYDMGEKYGNGSGNCWNCSFRQPRC